MKDLLQKCLDFLVDNNVPNCEDLKNEIQSKLNFYIDSEPLGYVSKIDLETLGYNIDNIDCSDLKSIAEELMDTYTKDLY